MHVSRTLTEGCQVREASGYAARCDHPDQALPQLDEHAMRDRHGIIGIGYDHSTNGARYSLAAILQRGLSTPR